MHALRLPGVPPLHSSFKEHRFDTDPSRFSLNLSLPKPHPSPGWGFLPSPPMSGSPPPDESYDPSQLAGHRRKRSDSLGATAPARSELLSISTHSPAQDRRITQHLGTPAQGLIGIQPPPYSTTFPVTQSYGYGPAGPTLVTAPSNIIEGHFAPGPVSPRATRKTKAHVASACVNCKKKHLRCDNARPCRRCVGSGKESMCVDVEHKKRGRPPLKADDNPSRRTYETALSPLRGSMTDPSRRLPTDPSAYLQQRPSGFQRDIRPLQPGMPSEMSRPLFRPGTSYQPTYTQPLVSPSRAVASGGMIPQHPPYSSSSSAANPQASSPYYMTPTTGMSPGGYEANPRSAHGFGGSFPYPSPQPLMATPTQPAFSYAQYAPTGSQHQARVEAAPPGGFVSPHGMAPDLQLPPIRPAPPGAYIDPAIAQQQRQVHHQSREVLHGGSNTAHQPEPKRPKMAINEILGRRHD